MPKRSKVKGKGVILYQDGKRKFAFYFVANYGRGEVRVTAHHSTRRAATAALFQKWPSMFWEWYYGGERFGVHGK